MSFELFFVSFGSFVLKKISGSSKVITFTRHDIRRGRFFTTKDAKDTKVGIL